MPIPHFKHDRSWKSKSIGQSRGSNTRRRVYSNVDTRQAPPKKKRKSNKGTVKTLLPYGFILTAVGILFVLFLFAWYSRNLPRPDKIIDRSVAQSTKIYDKSGEHLLFEAFDTERRTIIPLGNIPEHVKQSTILIEDQKFYTHKGFDLRGIARAAIRDILTLSTAEGGSTLTQQLVKNALLTNEKAISRKIKELVISYQIERKFSKDQILQLYFNEIPYGSNAYGIESASQFYFGKSAKDLSIAEGATIAALPKAPTYYSPYGSNLDDLLARKNYIIGLLEEAEIIMDTEAQTAREEELEFSEKSNLIKAPHFVIMVREALAREYGERQVEEGGLKVITSIDWDIQQAAEEAIENFAETNAENYDATNAALVAIDPKTGHILAMVGSKDYFSDEIDGNFNVAVQGQRQPGSSLKPLVYSVGFEQGYTDKTTLWDVVTKFGEGVDGEDYEPHDYDLEEKGPISVRTAIQGSINIPAVKMLYLVGSGNVIKKAKKFGYTTLGDPNIYGLSLVLGGGEITLLEHTNGYATFASEGIFRPTVSILKVEDNKGKVLEEWEEDEGERVMDEDVVAQLTDIISDNEARAPFFGEINNLTLGSRPVAGKTGTTNDYRDAWMMGYTPQLAAGIWVGNNDFSPMRRGAGGSSVAAPIWNRFMRAALEGEEIERFKKIEIEYPDKPILNGGLEGGTPVKIDKATGKLATEDTPESFIEEKVFQTGHNILHYIDPDNPLGDIPDENDRDHQYADWEESVQRWMEENEWEVNEDEIPVEDDDLHVPENKPTISIISPSENDTVSGDIILFKAEASAPRGVSRVEFYVDGALVAEGRSQPYTGRFIPDPTQANGFHELRAIAYDDVDNNESAYVTFNLFLEKSGLSVDWKSPSKDEIIDETEFPVQIELDTPEDLSKVEIFATPKENPSQYTLIRTVSTSSTSINTFWDTVPGIAGEYEIYAVLWDSNNVPHRVEGLSVILDVPEPEQDEE